MKCCGWSCAIVELSHVILFLQMVCFFPKEDNIEIQYL